MVYKRNPSINGLFGGTPMSGNAWKCPNQPISLLFMLCQGSTVANVQRPGLKLIQNLLKSIHRVLHRRVLETPNRKKNVALASC